MNKKLKVKLNKNKLRPKSEVQILICDYSKAKKILKWEPQHKGKIGMKLALIKTINWYQRNYLNKLLNLKSKKIFLNKNMTIEKNLLLNFESFTKKNNILK